MDGLERTKLSSPSLSGGRWTRPRVRLFRLQVKMIISSAGHMPAASNGRCLRRTISTSRIAGQTCGRRTASSAAISNSTVAVRLPQNFRGREVSRRRLISTFPGSSRATAKQKRAANANLRGLNADAEQPSSRCSRLFPSIPKRTTHPMRHMYAILEKKMI